jgi:hypothetical protein
VAAFITTGHPIGAALRTEDTADDCVALSRMTVYLPAAHFEIVRAPEGNVENNVIVAWYVIMWSTYQAVQ